LLNAINRDSGTFADSVRYLTSIMLNPFFIEFNT